MNKEDAIAQLQLDAIDSKIEKAVLKFAVDLEKMEKEHGTEALEPHLSRLLNIDYSSIELVSEQVGSLEENRFKAGYELGKKTLQYIFGGGKNPGIVTAKGRAANRAARLKRQKDQAGAAAKAAKGKGGGAAATGGAIVGGGAAGAGGAFVASTAGDLLTRSIDQDVHIDDVNPDTPPLNVASEPLEKLLKSTLEAIQNLTQAIDGTKKDLSGKLDSIDKNQDDLIGIQTGLSGEQVASQQGVRGSVDLRSIEGGRKGPSDREKTKELEKRIKSGPKDKPSFEERP